MLDVRGPGDGEGLLHQQQAVLHRVREPRDGWGGGGHHRGREDLLLRDLPLQLRHLSLHLPGHPHPVLPSSCQFSEINIIYMNLPSCCVSHVTCHNTLDYRKLLLMSRVWKKIFSDKFLIAL